jgi:hypothetical protein
VDRYPVRIGAPAPIRSNSAVVPQTYRTVNLSPVATELYKRVSGNPTVLEILDYIGMMLNISADGRFATDMNLAIRAA